MKPVYKRIFLSGVLATLGMVTFAQTPPSAAPAPAPTASAPAQPWYGHMGRRDPAKLHQHMVEQHSQRMADLKTKLKITTAQEHAWTVFATAMQPPAQPFPRADRTEWEKLTTPQRIDRMQAFRTERNAEMTKRADATKAFYASLSAEQKKVFDTETLRGNDRRGRRGEGWGGYGMGYTPYH